MAKETTLKDLGEMLKHVVEHIATTLRSSLISPVPREKLAPLNLMKFSHIVRQRIFANAPMSR
jgi:hypothetical protein